jgi:hypothetical protein
MKLANQLATIALAAGLVACGSYTDAGKGSNTLTVEATARFAPGGDEGMRLRVNITKDGQHVDDATVVFEDGDSTDTFFAEAQGNGRYEHNTGSRGYRRKLELKISREGTDDELEAKLEGPGPFRIETPANDDIVEISDGDELEVVWVTEDGIKADEVRVQLDEADYEDTDDEDDGQVEVPRSRLRLGADQVEIHRVNRVKLEGGAGNSSFTISYEASNDIQVVE